MSTKKTITTILVTLLIMIISITILFTAFAFVFPKTSAKFFYDLGGLNTSSNLYYRDYNRTNDIHSLAYALNLSIENNNSNKIIKYSDQFFNHKNYDDYIQKLNTLNLQSDLIPLVKSTVINEDNYYKNMYVQALIKKNKIDEAFYFASNNLDIVHSITNLGCYTFSWFFKDKYINLFNENYLNTDTPVGKIINDYFYQSYDFYFDNITAVNHENKPYFIALANRIDNVGRNVYYINSVVEGINGEDILDKIFSVNKSLQQLLGGK